MKFEFFISISLVKNPVVKMACEYLLINQSECTSENTDIVLSFDTMLE